LPHPPPTAAPDTKKSIVKIGFFNKYDSLSNKIAKNGYVRLNRSPILLQPFDLAHRSLSEPAPLTAAAFAPAPSAAAASTDFRALASTVPSSAV
jgi:hypothetical protein